MQPDNHPIFIGDTAQKLTQQAIRGEYVTLTNSPGSKAGPGSRFYKISNYDGMPPFFMSIVSSSNHWLFISSSGGLTAGRVSAEQALFPYYTEDKLTENSENSGSKTILLVTRAQKTSLWEPFSDHQRGSYAIERNIYKNVTGTTLLFEEINTSLGLTYRYAWRSGDAFGFIKTGWLQNNGPSACQVELLDGLQNILPANITSQTQNAFSPLLDAYKRSELEIESGLGIFSLNSTLTDLAEPSESLLATTVFQVGLEQAETLLSSQQLNSFRTGRGVETETEVRGRRGAYFVHSRLELAAGHERAWHLVAEVCQDSTAILALAKNIREKRAGLAQEIEHDIALNNTNLEKIVASADGLQSSNDALCASRHFANVMFNVMRGGIFTGAYALRAQDFSDFVALRNRPVFEKYAAFFSDLPAEIELRELQARALASGQEDLIRLSYAYLPLSFSRRHGDPSRPWNRFAIDIKKSDGSMRLGYEGNWRDIFQNWEALAYAYPDYIESMIATFLNATTADGYNPYRITNQGIDWEEPDPGNPWANIGYWSDHQIIYLQKLLEISAKVHPGRLENMLSHAMFSYANVPYRIKAYEQLLHDPFNSIEFNWELEREINQRMQQDGTDSRLALSQDGSVYHTNLTEKLLTLLLAKLANFVPQGGIWMNTQRPEWNDANNALVGKGLSVVTLAYLRRSIVFFMQLLERQSEPGLRISMEVKRFYAQVSEVLERFQDRLKDSFNDQDRRAVMDALGQAGSEYRWDYYVHGFSGLQASIPAAELAAFLQLCLDYVEHSLRANQRSDRLYHAYNILHLGENTARISTLYEMLEGQVAILSSGLLSGAESLALLESLRNSALYRADQHSYILYPDRKLAGFLEKNSITPEQVSGLGLVDELVRAQDKTLIVRDGNGTYHFSGQLRNGRDVSRVLDALGQQPRFTGLVQSDSATIKTLFENIFHHDEFTGRSGSFFAYEGLGSIYWHMVSKLLLAVQETVIRTKNEPSGLLQKYTDIRLGLSFNKSPAAYGAFPTDPYSHTPKDQGARQPGMTGSVKEEILTRLSELGYGIENGSLVFDFLVLDRREFLAEGAQFDYWDTGGQPQQIEVPAGGMAYTICQVPVILQAGSTDQISVHRSDGSVSLIAGHVLGVEASRAIFQRDGSVHHLVVSILTSGA